jgi:hypothetical protein
MYPTSETHGVSSFKDPVEVQIPVGFEKCHDSTTRIAVHILPWQAQEVLQTIPSEEHDS